MIERFASYLPYLLELRWRCLKACLVLAVTFFMACYYHHILFYYLAQPLLTAHIGYPFISISVLSPVFISIKFAFYVSLFVTMPYHLYQGWRFIYPALHAYEQRALRFILLLAIGLFYLGIIVVYYVVIPILLAYLSWWLPTEVQLMPDVGLYLDFCLSLFILFGLIFEIPVVLIVLLQFAWVDLTMLKRCRPYVIVLAFVFGMLLTPPDVLSQVLVAIPIWLLYELGMALSGWWLGIRK